MSTQNRLPGRFFPGALTLLLGLAGSAGALGQAAPAGPVKFGFLQEYCTECHNATDWAGCIAYDTLGEICRLLRQAWGEYQPPTVI